MCLTDPNSHHLKERPRRDILVHREHHTVSQSSLLDHLSYEKEGCETLGEIRQQDLCKREHEGVDLTAIQKSRSREMTRSPLLEQGEASLGLRYHDR